MTRRFGTNFTHGYSGYCNYYCRCDVCKAAGTEYMRARRHRAKAAREATGGIFVVEGIKHGSAAYNNHGCRCETCTTAAAATRRRQRAARGRS